jgi:plastocyanin
MLAAAFCLTPFSAASADPDWAQARIVEVDLSSFKFVPRTIVLPAGKPVLLRLVNKSNGGHDFTARDFFAASQVRQQDRARIEDGSIELGGRQSIEVALVPAAGRYRLVCSHAFHSTFGMKGRIVVQ